MDVQMPVMDGIEATSRIRRLEGPAGKVPIVGLTAHALASEHERYLAAGMNECLLKPIDWTQLFAILAHYGSREAGSGSDASPTAAKVQEAVLLDREVVDELRATLPTERLASFVQRAIHDAEQVCKRLEGPSVSTAELVHEAHSLKGVSATLGLGRISALAADIEAAARDGRDVAELVKWLREAVVATDAELRACGFVTAENVVRLTPATIRAKSPTR
jgi:CheY-like chemotaxis protein